MADPSESPTRSIRVSPPRPTTAETELGDSLSHWRPPKKAPTLHPGDRVGQHEIIRQLGRGGMGVVYLARDLRLGRRVAIKLISELRPELHERLMVEARAIAQCRHENIVVIYEIGEYEGTPYLVLEYLEGRPPSARDERAPRDAVALVVPVLRALEEAHARGIVHRDLKPDNVFVTRAGAVKVLDFGIAKAVDVSQGELAKRVTHVPGAPREDAPRQSMVTLDRSRETQDGHVVGTPPYMAPEQLRGEDVDGRADLWSVAVMLFQLITAKHPLGEELSSQMLLAVALDVLPMPSADDMKELPRELAEILARAWSVARDDRFDGAREMREALEAFLHGGRTSQIPQGAPYPGLRTFDAAQAGVFFGRETEVRRAVARLRDVPLLTLVGPSGVGKSSLVRAGIAPALTASSEAWRILETRPGRAPLRALAELGGLEAETLLEEPGALGAALRARAREEDVRILLCVDQLEELYTQTASDEERAAYAGALLGVADDAASPLRAILSVRADFVDRVAEHRRLLAAISGGLTFLPPLDRDALRQPLVRPAELAGYRFESEAFVDEILDALPDSAGALPMLQFTAARLWDARDEERRLLTRESYLAIGGVEGALASHADDILAELGPGARDDARAMLLRLVSRERTRAIERMDDVVEAARDPEDGRRILERFIAARLLVAHGDEEETTIEIVHESLLTRWPRLRRWLDEELEETALLLELQDAARDWDERGRPPGLLLLGDPLDQARRWSRRHPDRKLPSREASFLAESLLADARARRRVRNRRIAALSVLGLAAVAAFIGMATVNAAERESRRQAELARDEAERALDLEQRANELAARAETEEAQRRRAEAEAELASAAAERASEEAESASLAAERADEDLHEANARLRGALQRTEQESMRARQAQSQAEREAERAQRAEQEVRSLLNEREARVRELERRLQRISTELR